MSIHGLSPQAKQWLESNTQSTSGKTTLRDQNPTTPAMDIALSDYLKIPNADQVAILGKLDDGSRKQMLEILFRAESTPATREAAKRVLGSDPMKANEYRDGPAYRVDWRALADRSKIKEHNHAMAVAAQRAYGPFPSVSALKEVGIDPSRPLTAADIPKLEKVPNFDHRHLGDLLKAGFEVHLLRGKGSTQAIVAVHPKDGTAIVDVRGTETSGEEAVNDLLRDAAFCKVKGHGGQVHRGFMNAFNEVRDGVRRILEDAAKKHAEKGKGSLKLFFTGHSLGAANTTLAAEDIYSHFDSRGQVTTSTKPDDSKLIEIVGVHTFGSPLVFDPEGARNYERRLGAVTWRTRNNEDVVCRVPPESFGFVHVGNELYYDNRGKLVPGGAPISTWKKGWKNVTDLVAGTDGGVKKDDALWDHGPHGYVKVAFLNRQVSVDWETIARKQIDKRLEWLENNKGQRSRHTRALVGTLYRFADRPKALERLTKDLGQMPQQKKEVLRDALAAHIDSLLSYHLPDLDLNIDISLRHLRFDIDANFDSGLRVSDAEAREAAAVLAAVPKHVREALLKRMDKDDNVKELLDELSDEDKKKYPELVERLQKFIDDKSWIDRFKSWFD